MDCHKNHAGPSDQAGAKNIWRLGDQIPGTQRSPHKRPGSLLIRAIDSGSQSIWQVQCSGSQGFTSKDETPLSNPHVRRNIHQRTRSAFPRSTDYFQGNTCTHHIRARVVLRHPGIRKKIVLTPRELLVLRENLAGSTSADTG